MHVWVSHACLMSSEVRRVTVVTVAEGQHVDAGYLLGPLQDQEVL